MERAAALGREEVIGAADLAFLGETARQDAAEDWLAGDLPSAVARLERAMILRALRETRGNRTEAARRLGIHRQLLYTKMRQFGLETLSAEATAPVRGQKPADTLRLVRTGNHPHPCTPYAGCDIATLTAGGESPAP